MPERLAFTIVFVAFIAAFLTNAAFGEENGRTPSMLDVAGGIMELGEDEIYVSPFTVAREAVVPTDRDNIIDCEIPTISEYLMAAKLPGFKVVQAFESLQPPPDDACSWSREVLEAEGIDGNVYFGGIGSHVPSELEFIYGGNNPRDSISRIHSNPFTFWGDEYKPASRATRCVQRSDRNFSRATTNKRVLVKSRRSQASKTKMTLPRGTQVTIVYRSNDWSFITAAGPHECQNDPEWTTFQDSGWILTTDSE